MLVKRLCFVFLLFSTIPTFAIRESKIERSNYLSVLAFGAVPDDEFDDTAAIQKALDNSFNNGIKIIYFPTGVYNIGEMLFDTDRYGVSSSLHVYSGQTLIFEYGAVLKRNNANVNHMLYSHNDSSAVGYTGCHDITIIGALVDENASLGTTDTAFNFSHGERINIIACEFFGASGNWHSIEINSCRTVVIDNCIFRDNSNSEDIQIDAALGHGNLGIDDHTVCYDVRISNCHFLTDSHYSIGNHSDAPHHDITIENNCFEGSGKSGEFISFVPMTQGINLNNNLIKK